MADPGTDYADGGVRALTLGPAELRMVLENTSRRGQLAVVDFSASWCGPCRAMEPVLHRMAEEHRGRVAFVKVDCEQTSENQQLAREAGITAFPTFHIYRAGQRVGEFRGANRQALQQALEQQLPLLAPAAPQPQHGAGGAVAALGPPGPMATALAQALATTRASCAYDDFLGTARTLLMYVSNALAHPDEVKYRRIRMSNAAFQANIYSKPGGKEAMAALGFQERQEEGLEGEEQAQEGGSQSVMLVMDTIAPELSQVKSLLEQAIPGSSSAPPTGGVGTQARPWAGPAGATAPVAAPRAGAPPGGTSNVDAAALARALAAAMGAATGGVQPQAGQEGGSADAVPGARPPARQATPPAGGSRGQPRVVRVTVPMLARMLEKVLVDSGIGAPRPI